jgi:hypothetical protein
VPATFWPVCWHSPQSVPATFCWFAGIPHNRCQPPFAGLLAFSPAGDVAQCNASDRSVRGEEAKERLWSQQSLRAPSARAGSRNLPKMRPRWA